MMGFSAPEFWLACFGFCVLYYLLARHVPARNVLLVVASVLFYAWWDWRFLALLLLNAGLTWWLGLRIQSTAAQRAKRLWLTVGLAVNLSLLGFFKYFDFFSLSLTRALHGVGVPVDLPLVTVVLPLGLSFYTFRALSYLLDLQRADGRVSAERNPLTFFACLLFFPTVIAGPIDRPGRLLSQFNSVRLADAGQIRAGVWLIIYGLFLKIAVADVLSPWVAMAFSKNLVLGWTAVLGTLAFGLQLYADFNGYSLIAKGIAALLGFEVSWNFTYPYWSASISDFWRRWHVSLSSWFRDYVYVPLGRDHSDNWVYVSGCLFVTMLATGLWHGAGWNYLLWGAWHALFLVLDRLWLTTPFSQQPVFKRLGTSVTLVIVFVGWAIFRVQDLEVAGAMLRSLMNWEWFPGHLTLLGLIVVLALPIMALEAWERAKKDRFVVLHWRGWLAPVLQGAMLVCVIILQGSGATALTFLYFRF